MRCIAGGPEFHIRSGVSDGFVVQKANGWRGQHASWTCNFLPPHSGAAFSTCPDSGRQVGRRRSVDHSHAHAAGGGKSAAVRDKAAPKTPPKAPTLQAAAAQGHSFKWDVNAPEFMPHATKA